MNSGAGNSTISKHIQYYINGIIWLITLKITITKLSSEIF